MNLVLGIHEAGQIIINHLFEHGKIDKKETTIRWDIDSSDIEKSIVNIIQES